MKSSRPRSLISLRARPLIIVSVVLTSSAEYQEIAVGDTTTHSAWPTHGDKSQGLGQKTEPLLDESALCYKSNNADYQALTQASVGPYEKPVLVSYMLTPTIHQAPPAYKEPNCYVRQTPGSSILPDTLSQDLNAIKPIDTVEFPPWYYHKPPRHPGITIVPQEIPHIKISTFLGSLGHARSKGFVIPVNKEGVPGWEKRAIRKGESVVVLIPKSTGPGFITSTKVLGKLVPTSGTIGTQPIMTSMTHRMKPFYGQTLTASTISNKPTSANNAPFKESIKLASIQAFSQMGIIFVALLALAGIAVVFICISSFFKFPIPFLRRLRFGNNKKAGKTLRPKKTDTRDIDFEELVGDATLNPYGRSRYLRGTAEAVDNNSLLQGGSQISGGSTESGTSRETVSVIVTMNTGKRSGIEDNAAVVATGSQSKLTGVKLRRTQSC